MQNHPDPHGNRAQNTDLDALNPTILFIRRETARNLPGGKGKTIFGFHPTKLPVGPSTPRAGIIIPHNPQGGCGGISLGVNVEAYVSQPAIVRRT